MVILPWLDLGGADQVALDVIATLSQQGARVLVVTTQPSRNARISAASAAGAQTWVLPDLMPDAMIPGAIVDIARRHRVDVVHIINSRAGYDVIPALRRLAEPPRLVAHMVGEEGPRRGYPHYATALHALDLDVVLAVSDDLGRIVASYGVPTERIRVVRPAIDLQRFSPRSAVPPVGEGLRVLMPARVSDDKDPLLAVQVVRAARDAGLDVTLTITGDGPLLHDVRCGAEALGIAPYVVLTGMVDDMTGSYGEHDVVLLTSRFEASPLAVCEAMACAVPVVAPAVGGIPELLGDDAGVLVTDRDPRSFAKALGLLTDPARRQAFGRAGRARAETLLAADVTSGALLDAYRDLLSARVSV